MEDCNIDVEAIDPAYLVVENGVAGDPQDAVLLCVPASAKPTTSPMIGWLRGGP